MSRKIVSTLRSGDVVEDYFLLRTCDVKQTNQMKDYLDIMLGDQSGTINAKLWDCHPHHKADFGQCINLIVKVKGYVSTYRDTLQMKLEYIKLATESDRLHISDFIPAAPMHPADMMAAVYHYIEHITQPDMKRIVEAIVREREEDFMKYPAGKVMHHAVYGGLAYHTVSMLELADAVCRLYPMLNRDLLISGIILHDLCKIEEFEDEYCSDYSIAGKLVGHIVLMSNQIHQKSIELGITGEAPMLLNHMVLAHHDKLEYGSPVRPMIREAEVLHHLDVMDARIFAMNEAIEKSNEDALFTDPVRVLENRKLYKPKL